MLPFNSAIVGRLSFDEPGSLLPRLLPSVSNPTISGAKSWAIRCTSATGRDARGLGSTTMRAPGIPREAARRLAARVKLLVMTLTEGVPWDSVITVSWRPHAVQEPQSAMAWMMASHSDSSASSLSPGWGALYVDLRE